LSTLQEYATPIGNLPLDLESECAIIPLFPLLSFSMVILFLSAITQLRETGKFTDMSVDTDEDEHSIEMQLPYVRKVFQEWVMNFAPRMKS